MSEASGIHPEESLKRAHAARQGSAVEALDQLSLWMAKTTGTEKENPQFGRLLACMGLMLVATAAVSRMPNQDVASLVSNIIGGIGGSFAGDTWRPVSRWEADTKRMLGELEEQGGNYSPEDFVGLLSQSSDVLNRTQLRQYILRPSLLDREDPRYAALALLIEDMLKGQKSLSGNERLALRREVRDIWRRAETMAQELRADKGHIRQEGLLRAGDFVVGMVAAFAFGFLLTAFMQGLPIGGLAGTADDFVSAGLIGSSLLKRGVDMNRYHQQHGTQNPPYISPQPTHHQGIKGHQYPIDMRQHMATKARPRRR